MNAIHRLVIHRLMLSCSMLFTLSLATGCPGDEEQPPVAEGSDTGPGEDSGTSTGTGGATVDDTGTDSGGEACVEEPSDPIEILNGCTDATCEPFANTPERLPLLNADGSLPPLP